MSALDDLVAALDEDDSDSTSTSVRQPASLRRALKAAVRLGFADTANEGLNNSLREALEGFAMRAALEAHFTEHPDARPALHQVAEALAVIDRDPLAERPDLIRQAAAEVVQVRPDADGADVLLWAASLLAHEGERRARKRTT